MSRTKETIAKVVRFVPLVGLICLCFWISAVRPDTPSRGGNPAVSKGMPPSMDRLSSLQGEQDHSDSSLTVASQPTAWKEQPIMSVASPSGNESVPTDGTALVATAMPAQKPQAGAPLVIYLAVDISRSMNRILTDHFGEARIGAPVPRVPPGRGSTAPVADVLSSIASLAKAEDCPHCQLRVLAFADTVHWVNPAGSATDECGERKSKKWELRDADGSSLRQALNQVRACASVVGRHPERLTNLQRVSLDVYKDWVEVRRNEVDRLRREVGTATSSDAVQSQLPQPVLVIISDGRPTDPLSEKLAGDYAPSAVVTPATTAAISREFASKLDIASLAARIPFLVLVQGPTDSPPRDRAKDQSRLRRENPSAWVSVTDPMGFQELNAFLSDARRPPWHYVEIGDSSHARVEPGYPSAGRFGRQSTMVRAGVGLALLPASRTFGWHAANADADGLDSTKLLLRQGVRVRLDAMVLLLRDKPKEGCFGWLRNLWSEGSQIERENLVMQWTEQGVCLTEELLGAEAMTSWQLHPVLTPGTELHAISLVQNKQCSNNIMERGPGCFLALTEAGLTAEPQQQSATFWPHVSETRIELEEPPLFPNQDQSEFRVACVTDAWPSFNVCSAKGPLTLVVVEKAGDTLRKWSGGPPQIERIRNANGDCNVKADWGSLPNADAERRAVIKVENATTREQNCHGVRLAVAPSHYLAQYVEPRHSSGSLSFKIGSDSTHQTEVWFSILCLLLVTVLSTVGIVKVIRLTRLSQALIESQDSKCDEDGYVVAANAWNRFLRSPFSQKALALPAQSDLVDCVFAGLTVVSIWKWFGPSLPGQPTLPICAAHVGFFVALVCMACMILLSAKSRWMLLRWVAPHLLVSWGFLYFIYGPTTPLIDAYRAAFLEPAQRALDSTGVRLAGMVAMLSLPINCFLFAKDRKGLSLNRSAAILAIIILALPTVETLAVLVGSDHPEAIPLIRRSLEALICALPHLWG